MPHYYLKYSSIFSSVGFLGPLLGFTNPHDSPRNYFRWVYIMFSVSKSQPLLCNVQVDPRKFKLLQRICTDGLSKANHVNFLQLPRLLWMSLGSRCFVGLQVITALRGAIKFLVVMLLFTCIKTVVLKWLAFYFTLNDYCWLFWN